METDIRKYIYKGLTPTQEGETIGYALIMPGTILEDLTEIDDKCVGIMLCSPPLKDYAAIKKFNTEMFIRPILYSKFGNYLGEETEIFTPVDISKLYKD